MRKRSDRKRQAILDAAYGLFRERGFEKASMSQICARAGGSKATIYGYFPSKEELFVECMFDHAENYLEGILGDLQSPADDTPSILRAFGESFLRLICSPEMVALRRLMIAEAERAGIGRLFYEKLTHIRQQVASFLMTVMAEGGMLAANSDLAASQLRALLEAELFEQLLLCAGNGDPDDETIASASRLAVETFLRAYAQDARPQVPARSAL